MRGKKGLKKITRHKNAHPSDYVTFLTQYQDAGTNLVKKSKVFGGQTDVTFHCKDGLIKAHQMILCNHSQFLKRMFLEQHSFEFSMIEFEKGIAQMTGRRASDQPLDIILPDFTKDDLKRLFSCFYTGEILIDDEVQSLALKNLWIALRIDSMKLSDLEFIEIESVDRKKKFEQVKSSLNNLRSNSNSNSFQQPPIRTTITPPLQSHAMSEPKKLTLTRQGTLTQLNQPHTPLKCTLSSPLKAVSFKSSPAKDGVNKQFSNFICPKCQANISFHGRDVNGNLRKFQMHLISHFQDILFSDVPFLSIYICPHDGPKCKEKMINRISFLCHLSLVHSEFYPRMQRMISNQTNGFQFMDVNFFNHIIATIKTYPTLKIDLENCPSQYDLTDELEIYKAAETCSLDNQWNDIGQYQCKCGMNCDNQDYAVLHQFLEHAMTFFGHPRVLKDAGVYLSCQDCKFATFSKSQYLSHIGHGHGKFEEISTRLCSSIKGASIDLYQLFKKSSPQASNQYQNVITYSLTRGQNSNWSQKTVINYECEKCMFETSHFPSLFLHVTGKLGNQSEHSLPMIFKCKNCEKSELQHKIEEDFFKSHDCYVFQPINNSQIATPAATGAGSNLVNGPTEQGSDTEVVSLEVEEEEEDLELESIQEVYIPMNHEQQNNHPQDGATGIKRTSLALTPPPINKRLKSAGLHCQTETVLDYPTDVDNSSPYSELIELE